MPGMASLRSAIFIYALLQPIKTLRNIGKIIASKDMIFDKCDLLPFFMQAPLGAYWIIKGIVHGGPTKASTVDIEFNMENI
jgi:hypothetical protein